jgi:hypothetical protein
MSKYSASIKNLLKIADTPNDFFVSSPSKITIKGNSAFSLPAGPIGKGGTCPGATRACESCYAMKGRHHFRAVQTAIVRNKLLLTKLNKHKSFNKAVSLLLEMVPENATIFRIHESGDFYSQWYVQVWTKVVAGRPNVRFWAYTRSFHLDFYKLVVQSNFELWASTDDYNKIQAEEFVKRYSDNKVKHAYGPWKHNEPIPNNSFVCPVNTKKLKVEGACEKCMLCVVKDRVRKNVVFLAH